MDTRQPPSFVPPMPSSDWQPPTMPDDFPNFTDRLRRTWERFTKKALTFLKFGALMYAVPVAAIGCAAVAVFAAWSIIPSGPLRIALTVAAGLVAVAAVAAAIVFQTAITATAAFKAESGLAPFNLGLRSAWPVFMTQLLCGLVVVLPGFIFIPAIILAVRFALVASVVVTERRQGLDALLRSRDLTFGRGARLFVELLLTSIGFSVLIVILNAVAIASSGLLPAATVAGAPIMLGIASFPLSLRTLFTVLVTLSAQILTVPLVLTYLQVFYEDCAVRVPSADWKPDPKRRRSYAALASLGLIVTLAMLISPAVLIVTRQKMQPGSTVAPAAQPQQAAAPQEQPPKENLTPESRDLRRYNDVSIIKVQLGSMYNDTRAYPDSLDALAPKYLSTVPHDPSDNSSYGYEKLDQTYKISFTFENGILGMTKGPHFLTPDGVDVEAKPMPPPPPPTVSVQVIPPPTDASANPLPPEPGQTAIMPDSDGDGLSDADEATFGTDPHNPDSDGDGLTDGEEVHTYHTNPMKKDTDGDRLSDGDEVHVYRTDPLNADSDGDGFSDSQELQKGYEPNGPGLLSPERKAQIQQDTATYGLR